MESIHTTTSNTIEREEKLEIVAVETSSVPPVPPGYRFTPYDDELINYYLVKKVNDEILPPNIIRDVNIYKYSPDHLAQIYKLLEGEKVWYFFTPRDKKYPNGTRPNRRAGDGYWKATGRDNSIFSRGKKVGMKRSLVFYRGTTLEGEKTNWIMHEYIALADSKSPPVRSPGMHDMQLDKWVLCKMYQKMNKKKRESVARRSQEERKIDEREDSPPPPPPPPPPHKEEVESNESVLMDQNNNVVDGFGGSMEEATYNYLHDGFFQDLEHFGDMFLPDYLPLASHNMEAGIPQYHHNHHLLNEANFFPPLPQIINEAFYASSHIQAQAPAQPQPHTVNEVEADFALPQH